MSRLDNPYHDQEAGRADSTQDTTRIDDVRIGAVRPLISPALLQDDMPVPTARSDARREKPASKWPHFQGRDDRLVVVVGPCSIHDHDQALEYAHHLKVAADELQGRTADRDARLFRKTAYHRGLEGLHQRPAAGRQLPYQRRPAQRSRVAADISGHRPAHGHRFLDLLSPQYIADLIAWGAIGARTTESQSHRQLASGLSCPIGFKNGTDGGVRSQRTPSSRPTRAMRSWA